MKTILRTLPLAALICSFGCDVEDETVTRIGDGFVGVGVEADAEVSSDVEDALVEGDLADAPDATFAGYCDDVTTWDPAWTALEDQVLVLVNQRRAAGATCGGVSKPPVPALTADTRLRCAARKHSKDMGLNNYFAHNSQNGTTPWTRIKNAGYNYLQAAENIAAGYATASAVVTGWMNSTGHCNNIMNATLKHLGTGYYYAPSSTYKHYWTQDFGRQ